MSCHVNDEFTDNHLRSGFMDNNTHIRPHTSFVIENGMLQVGCQAARCQSMQSGGEVTFLAPRSSIRVSHDAVVGAF